MMNNPSLAVALLALVVLPGQAADTKHAPPAAPRNVQVFNALENGWLEAVQQRNVDAVKKFVADDFELRSATQAGDPIPRDESIKRSLEVAKFPSRLDQMTIREYGDIVTVSFVWKLGVPKTGMLSQQIFVVDTWKQTDGNWQVVERYAVPFTLGAGNAVPGAYAAPAAVVKKK